MNNTVIISGSSNIPLAKKIAERLDMELGDVDMEFFPNGESRIRVLENVKEKEVIIIQPTNDPTNKYIIELTLLVDAVKRSGATKVTAVMPWFGYSPQDKVFRNGEPLSSQVIVKLLEASGIDEFIVTDIHSTKVLEFFSKKVTNLSVVEVYADYFKKKYDISETVDGEKKWAVVSLDKGSRERSEKFAKSLGLQTVFFDKSRDRDTGEVKFLKMEGEVSGKKLIAFDDFTSTGSTLILSSEQLKSLGAELYFCCITHIVVNETAQKIQKSKVDRLLTTNSVNIPSIDDLSKVRVVDISGLIADFLRK